MIIKRFKFFFEFIQAFTHHALHIREAIGSLVLLTLFGGFAISKVESIKLGDSIYFAFITAMSIGYGDISPKTAIGKLLSVGIGLVGMLFVGVTVACATQALADVAKRHSRPKADVPL